jgi:hypothetical protein
MSDLIQPADHPLLRAIPERDLVEMAVDLDIFIPAQIDRMQMVKQCVLAIVDRGRLEGLPFSQYDQDDLDALPADERSAIAVLMGLSAGASTARILKKGQRVYRSYQKHRPDNATALLLPTLLSLIARAALTRDIR